MKRSRAAEEIELEVFDVIRLNDRTCRMVSSD